MPYLQVRSVTEYLGFLESLGWMGEPRAHVRSWFRGQADARWRLEPAVYRPGFIDAGGERERLKKERQMAQDFSVRSGTLISRPLTDVDRYFLQQHFGMPTRLLDWTASPLVALYFAVWNAAEQHLDGQVAALDAYKFNGPSHGSGGFATSANALLGSAVRSILNWEAKSPDFPEDLLAVRPTHFEPRMTLQRAGFMFHVPARPIVDANVNPTLVQAVIPADAKERIRKQLLNLGIDAASVYGDLASLVVAIKDVHGIGRRCGESDNRRSRSPHEDATGPCVSPSGVPGPWMAGPRGPVGLAGERLASAL